MRIEGPDGTPVHEDTKPRIHIRINNHPVTALVATGSEVSLIPAQFAKLISPTITKCRGSFGENVPLIGVSLCKVEKDDISATHQFCVVHKWPKHLQDTHAVIGLDLIREMKIVD